MTEAVSPDAQQLKLPLVSRRELTSRGRFRGLRRKLAKDLPSLDARQLPDNYGDLWHWHPESEGYGNLSAGFRRKQVALLLSTLVAHRETLQLRFKDLQTFVLLAPSSRDDALYVHTPNPNGTPFPLRVEGLRRSVELERTLATWWPEQEWIAYQLGVGAKTLTYIRLADFGVDLT